MCRWKNGVSLISLIITIIVIIILAGISIFSSLDTVNQSQDVKLKTEFEDVYTFVNAISIRAKAGKIDLNLTNETLVRADQLKDFYSPSGEFSAEEQNRVFSVNESKQNDPNKGYHYVEGIKIETDNIKGMENVHSIDKDITTPKRVKNNYIINFYEGVVIARISPNETMVRGTIIKDKIPFED